METTFFSDLALWSWRWLHVVAGIAWIGHLWFFNFVNANLQKELSADVKKVVNPGLMLRALFLFRWGAMLTYISGWALLLYLDYMARWGVLFSNGLGSLNDPANTAALWILVGMTFGTVMWFNVWFVIWPAQKRILGLCGTPKATPEELPAVRARAAKFSRINTFLSGPMLFGMLAGPHLGVFNLWNFLIFTTLAMFAVSAAYKLSANVGKSA